MLSNHLANATNPQPTYKPSAWFPTLETLPNRGSFTQVIAIHGYCITLRISISSEQDPLYDHHSVYSNNFPGPVAQALPIVSAVPRDPHRHILVTVSTHSQGLRVLWDPHLPYKAKGHIHHSSTCTDCNTARPWYPSPAQMEYPGTSYYCRFGSVAVLVVSLQIDRKYGAIASRTNHTKTHCPRGAARHP